MSDDLVKWLRGFAAGAASIVEGDRVVARMAADAIEQRDREIALLREELDAIKKRDWLAV